jgi:uncharacterized protein YjdB
MSVAYGRTERGAAVSAECRPYWRITAVALAILLGDCGDNVGPSTQPPPPPTGLIISDAVPAAILASAGVFASTPSISDSVVYVALTPEGVVGGTQATVRRVGSTSALTVPMFNGGFDPVPVVAETGDSIEVVITDAGGGVIQGIRLAVAGRRPPIVVRTQPPPRKRDQPLNAAIVVVFSEPVDVRTLTASSVRLLRGTTAVPGSVSRVEGSATAATVTPQASLTPNTDYELVVTQAVRDLSGQGLVAPVIVDFTTGTVTLGPVALVSVEPDSLEVPLGEQFQLTATAYDAGGENVPGRPVRWSTDADAVAGVSGSGLVTARREGVAVISAAVDRVVGTQLIRVSAAALPIGSVALFPDSTGELVGQSLVLNSLLYDTSGAPILSPRPMTWKSLDATVASVPEYSSSRGTFVTGVAVGLARIVGTAGGRSDTALVSVHDVAQVMVSPPNPSIVVGETIVLTATALDEGAVVYQLNSRDVAWASSNSAAASVDAIGRVTGVQAGTATVAATWRAHRAEASVTVVSAGSVVAPSGLTARVTGFRVGLSWGDYSNNEVGFHVQRSAAAAGPWAIIADIPASNPATWTGIAIYGGDSVTTEGQTCYRVIAFNDSGNSPPSNTVCVTPVAAPSILTASAIDDSTVALVWTDNSSIEDGHDVFRVAAGQESADFVVTLPPNATGYRDAVLTPNSYSYAVRAKRMTGYSGEYFYSDWARSGSVMLATAPPAIPSTSINASGSHSAVVAWYVADWGIAEGVRVERAPDSVGAWAPLATVAVGYYGTGSFEETKLESEMAACYRVIAFNDKGESAPSTARCITPPAAPTLVSVTPTPDSTQVVLVWNDNSQVENSYVYYAETAYGDHNLTFPANTSTATVPRLNACQHLLYATTADGGWSDFASFWLPVLWPQGGPIPYCGASASHNAPPRR